ncbi:MAG: hypothetical protein J1F02_08185, partial [Lachnospiraceae bacterium]|nr:hypothetical protein [Lachnospiraceae bacterium]
AYEVSARIFHWGFRPWKVDVVGHHDGYYEWKMVDPKPNTTDKKLPKVLRLVPGYLPPDYQSVQREGDMTEPHSGYWKRYDNSSYEILYQTTLITEDIAIAGLTDERLFQKRITVAGYEAFLATIDSSNYPTQTIIFWMDNQYMHYLDTTMDNAEQIIRVWAESIYSPPKPWQVFTFPADSPFYLNKIFSKK